MVYSRITRRRFVLTAIAGAAVVGAPRSWLPGSIAFADESQQSAFVRLTRLLFPHPGLADAVYAEVASHVFTSLTTNAESGSLLDSAENALNVQIGGTWLDADKESQIAAIRDVQGEAFFPAILAAVRGAFYYHPKVWAHINYPGPSKQYGGYKHRGFDDIDWLPEID